MLLSGWAIAILGAVLLYNWAAGKFDGILGIVVFVIIYLLFDIGNTMQGITGNTVGTIITNDPTQRPMTGLISTVYSYCVPLIGTNVITFVILPKYGMQYNLPMLGEMVYWFAAISFIFILIACVGVRKIDVSETFQKLPEKEDEKQKKASFREMWAVIKDNRNVQMYMLTAISDRLAQQTMSQSVVMTLMNGVLIGSFEATTMVGNFSQIIGVTFAFFGGLLAAKYGSKKVTVQWSWFSIIGAGLTFALCLGLCLTGDGVDGMKKIGVMGAPLIIYIILNIFKTGSQMVLTMTENNMRADLVDYEYERSGNYFPAVLAGFYNLIDKFITSLGSTIAMGCIALVGYVTTVPQLGDKATWPIFWVAMFLNFGMAIIGWLCNIIAMRFYTLDKERMIQVQKTLNERRAAAESEKRSEK